MKKVEILMSDYFTWLLTQPKEKIYTKENLQQIAQFTRRSSGRYFHLFFPDGKEANRIMDNSYFSSDIVDKIILEEEILPNVKGIDSIKRTYDEADWKRIYSSIEIKYGKDYAERNVLKGKNCIV